MDNYKAISKVLKNSHNIIIASHINPDGDAIGSSLVMASVLETMGKKVVVFNRDPVPSNLKFLEGSEKIVNVIPPVTFDAAVLVDLASAERAGDLFAKLKINGPTIVIDHHQIDNTKDVIACIDESASSAGEVVLRFLNQMKIKITPAIAMAIYCTIAVDTGFFKYSNTTEHVFRIAADLVALGADPWTVSKNLEESYSAERYHLLARVLNTLEVSENGAYASMEVTQKMITETGATVSDSEEFASIPRTINSVKVSALFRETPIGKIRISLRSKCDNIDVSALARQFSGGGHPFAAGCSIEGTLTEAKKQIAEAISKLPSTVVVPA